MPGTGLFSSFNEAGQTPESSPGLFSSYNTENGLFGDFNTASLGASQGYDQPFSEDVIDFLADQLDPLNILMLAGGAFLGGGFGLGAGLLPKLIPATAAIGKFARVGKFLGAAEGAAPEILGTSVSRRLLNRTAQSLGWSLPFASAEFFEEPEPGSSQAGEFADSLLFFTFTDLFLHGAGGALGRFGNTWMRSRFGLHDHRALAQSVNAVVEQAGKQGLSRSRAAELALADVVEQRVAGLEETLGPTVTKQILESADEILKSPAKDRLSLGAAKTISDLSDNPEILASLRAAGFDDRSLARLPAVLAEEAEEAAMRTAEKDILSQAEKRVEALANVRFVDKKWIVGAKTGGDKYVSVPLFSREGFEIKKNWDLAFGDDDVKKDLVRRYVRNYAGPDVRPREFGTAPTAAPGFATFGGIERGRLERAIPMKDLPLVAPTRQSTGTSEQPFRAFPPFSERRLSSGEGFATFSDVGGGVETQRHLRDLASRDPRSAAAYSARLSEMVRESLGTAKSAAPRPKPKKRSR